MPFGIDMWEEAGRGHGYVAKLGLQDKFSTTASRPDKDIRGQVNKLKDLGIKHVVVQAFDDQDQTPAGRLSSLEKLLDQGAGEFETVIVDTSVMNLPSTSFSLLANKLIKETLGLPCGGAYSNGTHMWQEAKTIWSLDGFKAMDAVVQGMASVLWSDFNFYGPIVTAPRIFPAVAAAHVLLSTLVYGETGRCPKRPVADPALLGESSSSWPRQAQMTAGGGHDNKGARHRGDAWRQRVRGSSLARRWTNFFSGML
jgi:tetrahydromethanopterin S-methyltransferase subunit H